MTPGLQQVGLGYEGDLPIGWKIVPAKQVCTKITDGTHDTPIPTPVGQPFITAINVKDGKIDFSKCLYVDEETHNSIFKRCNPQRGDLTIVNIGAGVGDCGYVEVDFEFSLKNVALLKPDPQKLDSRFLLHLHQSRRERISHTVKAGGAQPFLSLAELRRLPILLPNLPEQRRIAEILSTWDRAIETVEALIANAATQKKALMQSLLIGKQRLPGFSGAWTTEKLGNLCQISKGEQLGRLTMIEDGTIPVINGGIAASGYTDRANNSGGCITISEGGNSCGFVSMMDRPFWCGGHCYALKDLAVDRSFLFASLKHREAEIMTLRVGSGLPNIQKKALSGFELNLPPRAEQEAIGLFADTQDSVIFGLQAQLTALREEKFALMQQLLTGKRRVKVAEREDA